MLLNSISSISAFPSEVLLIDVNPVSPSLVNTKASIRFYDAYYDYDQKLKWDNNPLVMAAAIDDNTLVDTTTSFFMPNEYMNIPASFPLVYTVSGFTDHLNLDFIAGTSALSIYPSRPYPLIEKLSDNQISISAGFVPATAFSETVDASEYRKRVDITNIEILTAGNIILDGAFRTGIKKGIIIADVAQDVGRKVANRPASSVSKLTVPLTPPRSSLTPTGFNASERIIKDSAMVEVEIMTPDILEIYEDLGLKYKMYWDNTQISDPSPRVNRLLSPSIEYTKIEGEHVRMDPDIKPGYSPNISGAWKGDSKIILVTDGPRRFDRQMLQEALEITIAERLINIPASSIYLPQFSNVTIWYETSAFTPNSEISNTSTATNVYEFSSARPPYFNGYKFSVNTTAGIQPAFTVNYIPSASIVNDEISSIAVQVKMVDNYYQSEFTIDPNDNGLICRFTDVDDLNLSAIDFTSNQRFTANQWFPASAIMWFENDGRASYYNFSFETSSFMDSYFKQEDFIMLLNRDKAIVSLTQSNIKDNSVDIEGSIFPDYDPELDVIWNVFPPENIILRDLDTDNIIPLNTPVPGNSLTVRVENLGVDDTIISLYTTQYLASGSTTWIPSNEIWTNVRLGLFGEIEDKNPVNVGNLSAMFIRNGFRYRVPTISNIRWEETSDISKGNVELRTQDNTTIIQEGAAYPSDNNHTLIKSNFETVKAVNFPEKVNFRINCYVFNPFYNYQTGKTFILRQYPTNSNLFAIVSSTATPEILSTEFYSSIIYTQNETVILSADIRNIDISEYDITWGLNSTTFTGLSAEFEIDEDEICIGLSALNALPLSPGFGRYNFYDNVCFFILTGLEPFEYISFPEYNYLPTQNLTFDNYQTNYIELSSYRACHTENILFSATPNFDQYVWRTGDLFTTTNTNTARIPVTYADISGNNSIYVSAYNKYFPDDNPPTIFNTASSTGSAFNEFINFENFPSIILELTTDNNLTDMRVDSSRILNLDINTSVLDLSYGTVNLTLSSESGVYKELIELTNNSTTLSRIFRYGNLDYFTIPENFSQVFNLYIEGDIWKTINGFDFCSEQESLTSNIISISAFDGPDLDIWTDHNVLTINENAIIVNTTHDTIFNPFTSFTFWNGYEYQTGNISTSFSASYVTSGTYTVHLSGFRSNGEILYKEWPDFFIIDSGEEYDENVNRSMSVDIELPYSDVDILIPSNSWQFNTTLNSSFAKLDRNINFLNEQCFILSDDIPKYKIGSYGLFHGISKWRYTETSDILINDDSKFKDVVILGDKILTINNSNIEVRMNDNSLTLLNSISRITDIEIFKNPIKIDKVLGKVLILDQGSNSVYVTEFNDITNELSLTHYWGGIGDKNSRTKLNNPTDMYVSDEFIYIVDSDSKNIKIYNKYLNWINNLNIETKPVYITGNNDVLYILDENGTVYEFIDLINTNKFDAVVGKSILVNPDNNKIYISTNNKIIVFGENGTLVNEIHELPINSNQILINNSEMWVIYNHKIIKIYDILSYQKITSLSSFGDNSTQYLVHKDEPVTSFVINDSLEKLQNKLSTLADSLTGKFEKYYNIDDTFLSSSIVSAQFTLSCLSPSLGINEIVSYETINREIMNTYNCINTLADFINGDKIYPTQPPIWTWEYHKIGFNQRPNLSKTPLSWEELVPTNPSYSGVTWNSILSSTGYENSFPISWTWEDLEAGCLNAITWEEMEEGRLRAYTWEELEGDSTFSNPFFLFEPCGN